MDEQAGLESEPGTAVANQYDYDLVVIGGGSGGLACAKTAAALGARVCVLDYVKPSSHGSRWGLGGTCVNVGCIPKKLMHQAGLLAELGRDAQAYGWETAEGLTTHSWEKLVRSVQDYIRSLNFKYRVQLKSAQVTYENYLGCFIDSHTLELTNPAKKSCPRKVITAARTVIAVGGRPRPLDCPGGALAITSDDLFSTQRPPGKTLIIGASYVALECAGFLQSLGFDVTVMVRSVLLRGFDQEMAEFIGSFMADHQGVRFIRGATLTEICEDDEGRRIVKWKKKEENGKVSKGEDCFDCVLNATGRVADVMALGLSAIGVELAEGKIKTVEERTTVADVYAIGDCTMAPELTPVAIKAGQLLARRLFAGNSQKMDYSNLCTTIFTPLEYGCCGLSEEDAIGQLGEEGVDVYHSTFQPLEWAICAHRSRQTCYAKIIVEAKTSVVVGVHILAPHAGEIVQGFGVALKKKATYQDFLDTIGIHPTIAEEFTTLTVTKRSGQDAAKGGC